MWFIKMGPQCRDLSVGDLNVVAPYASFVFSSFDSAFFPARERLLSLETSDWTRVLLCYTEPHQVQWGSEKRASPVFKWSVIQTTIPITD